MVKRWLALGVIGLLLAGVLLPGCAGDDDDKDQPSGVETPSAMPEDSAATPTSPPPSTHTPTPRPTPVRRPPPPRSEAVPSVEPYDFEPPQTVGEFQRESVEGHATGTQTGGLRATYRGGDTLVWLEVHYLDTIEQAYDTVHFMLNADSVTERIQRPYTYNPAAAFGIGQSRDGTTFAAWNHYEWFFLVRTNGGLATLDAFMGAFPY